MLKIDTEDSVSLEVVNKKLESFVEVVLRKLIAQEVEIRNLKKRLSQVEKRNGD